MLRSLLIATILAAHLAGAGCPSTRPSRREALIATERAFAALAQEVGIRDAFLRYLSEDSVVFRPGPVAARERYGSGPPIPGILRWAPAHAEISSEGDLGYTTGPWDYRPGDESADPTAFGEFVSVWRARDDGAFELVADIGIDHGGPVTLPEQVTGTTVRAARGAGSAQGQDLEEAERALLASSSPSLAEALRARAAADLRLYRNGSPPAVGAAQIDALLGSTDGRFEGTRLGGGVASSGDLGWSYGTGRLDRSGTFEGETYAFLRVWRREPGGAWRIVVDVLVPASRQDGGS